MDILQRPSVLLSGIEPKNLIILPYQSKNMNGPGLFMECQRRNPKKYTQTIRKGGNNHHILDANLLHDITTGKSVTAVLHFVNTTPTDWFSKRQAIVETATDGSEFVATKTATEQIMDHRNTIRYLGIPVMTKAYMFGDNKSVVTSSTIAQSILNKKHNMLSYHRVREAIAAKILEFHWCPSGQNRSDLLSKHWDHIKVKDTVRELFEYQGDIILLKPD